MVATLVVAGFGGGHIAGADGTIHRPIPGDGVAAETMPAQPSAVRSVAEIYEDFSSAVVRVKLYEEDLDDEGKNIEWVATGFFISAQGRLLTNLQSSTRIIRAVIEKDGLQYAGQFLGGDLRTKLALVQLLKLPEQFAVIAIDMPDSTLPIGSPLTAISLPLELDATPTAGIVAGYESGFAQYVFPCSYMRTSIPLGKGEQGAPVFDNTGALAGVMVGSLPELRASYLVTPNSLKRIINDLAVHGRVDYGTLPVEFAEAPDKPYVARQVVISSVQQDSAAEAAGLRAGDVLRRLTLQTNRSFRLPPSLTALGDSPIRRISHVRDMLFYAQPGERMEIEVERDGQRIPPFNLAVETLRPAASDESVSAAPNEAEQPAGPPTPELPAPDTGREPPFSR